MDQEDLGVSPEVNKLIIIQHNMAKSPSSLNNLSDFLNKKVDFILVSECPAHESLPFEGAIFGLNVKGAAIIKLNPFIECVQLPNTSRFHVAVFLPQLGYTLHSFYIPPCHNTMGNRRVYRIDGHAFNDLIATLLKRKAKSIIGGDFNFESRLLCSDPSSQLSSSQADAFHLAVDEGEWLPINSFDTPTRFGRGTDSDSCIDWTLCHRGLADKCSWELVSDASKSDHQPILITVLSEAPIRRASPATVIDYGILKPFIMDLVVPRDLDSAVDIITQALSLASRPVRRKHKQPWWDEQCKESKKMVDSLIDKLHLLSQRLDPKDGPQLNRFKKRFPHMSFSPLADLEKEALLLELRQVKADLKEKAKEHRRTTRRASAQFNHEKLSGKQAIPFCVQQLSKSRRVKSPIIDIRVDEEYISDPSVISKTVLDKFFPCLDRNQLSCEPTSCIIDPPIGLHEIEEAIKAQPDTCPGTDGLNKAVLLMIFNWRPDFLLALFNHWFALRRIPKTLKKGAVVLIKKDPLKPNDLSNCRCLGLTSCLIKTFERILLKRINWWLNSTEEAGIFCRHQFAHRKDQCIDHALSTITQSAGRSFGMSNQNALFTLDISNAFNELDHQSIVNALCKSRVPSNLCEIFKDFLEDRSIFLMHHDRRIERKFKRGVNQGAISSPWAFNLTLSSCLNRINQDLLEEGLSFALTVFADDLTFSVNYIDSRAALHSKLNLIIAKVDFHLSQIGLKLSPSKSQLSVRIGNLVNPKLVSEAFSVHNVLNRPTTRILGLHYDYCRNFVYHVKLVVDRAKTQALKLRGFLKSGSLSNLGKKALIRQYIFSRVLFAVENWFTRIHSSLIQQALISLERWICIIIFSLPQTLPSVVALAANPVSVFIEAEKKTKWDRFRLNKIPLPNGQRYDDLFSPHEIWHPSEETRISYRPEITNVREIAKEEAEFFIYCDASKVPASEGKPSSSTGCAFVIYDADHNLLSRNLFHLNDEDCVFLAELLAIQLAVVHCVTEELNGRILILSDSRSAVLALRTKQTATNNILMTQMTIQEAIKSGRNRGVSIEVAWIKAHQATLFGNEEADKCAKQAAVDHHLPSYFLPFTKEQLKKEICTVNSIDLGEIYFKHKSGQTFKQFFPYLKKVEEMKPTFNKYTLRVYSGHGAFNFDAHKYFPQKISPLCGCKQTQNIEHLLIRCCFTLAECTEELESSGVAEQIRNSVPWSQICLLPPIHSYIKVAARKILKITGRILDESDPRGDFSFR